MSDGACQVVQVTSECVGFFFLATCVKRLLGATYLKSISSPQQITTCQGDKFD